MTNTNSNRASLLNNLEIQTLTPMQVQTVSEIESGKDVILLSPTGSGKTVAFLLPIIENLRQTKGKVQALILAPSRELAIQLESVFKQMKSGYKVNCCYGGHPMSTEKNNLKDAPAVLIGTPGRIGDHLRRSNFDPSFIRTLVLDEFDKALDLGFQNEMKEIIFQLEQVEQRILTSATAMKEIPTFTALHEPVTIDYLTNDVKPSGLTLKAVRSDGKDKLDAFYSLVCELGNAPMVTFVNHRDAAERISEHLREMGMQHGLFHGGLEQDERERALIKFRNGSHHLLIATDLASRGLDIPEIKYVIHYHLPTTEEPYVHRNGRTARMDAEGTAFLVLTESEGWPAYITEKPEFLKLGEKQPLPDEPDWITLYISNGKKDKINKIDIVGLFLKKGHLQKDDIGLIDVLDNCAFVAVRRGLENKIIKTLDGEKIKGKKLRLSVAR